MFSARIDPELAEWVKAEADRNGRLPARELEMMLRELRETRERRRRESARKSSVD